MLQPGPCPKGRGRAEPAQRDREPTGTILAQVFSPLQFSLVAHRHRPAPQDARIPFKTDVLKSLVVIVVVMCAKAPSPSNRN